MVLLPIYNNAVTHLFDLFPLMRLISWLAFKTTCARRCTSQRSSWWRCRGCRLCSCSTPRQAALWPAGWSTSAGMSLSRLSPSGHAPGETPRRPVGQTTSWVAGVALWLHSDGQGRTQERERKSLQAKSLLRYSDTHTATDHSQRNIRWWCTSICVFFEDPVTRVEGPGQMFPQVKEQSGAVKGGWHAATWTPSAAFFTLNSTKRSEKTGHWQLTWKLLCRFTSDAAQVRFRSIKMGFFSIFTRCDWVNRSQSQHRSSRKSWMWICWFWVESHSQTQCARLRFFKFRQEYFVKLAIY